MLSFQTFRRVPPAAPSVEILDGLDKGVPNGVFDEPEVKRIKSEPGLTPDNACSEMRSSDWKWNISDFRKENVGNPTGNSDVSKKHSNDSIGHIDALEQIPKDCDEASKNSKESEKKLGNSNGSSKRLSPATPKDPVNRLCNEDNPKECDKTLKPEFYLKKPARAFQNNSEYFQSWKLPVRSLKEALRFTNTRQSSHEVHSIPRVGKKSGEVKNFRNETQQNENMPVIIDVFSLSEATTKPFSSNPTPENSVLFTPPCSPPFGQFGNARADAVTNQNTSLHNEFMSPTSSQQLQKDWCSPVQHGFENFQAYTSVSHSKQVQQVDCTYQKCLPYPVKQINPQDSLYKSVKQIDSCLQEDYQKQAQQLRPQGYPNKTAQQVCCNNQENLPYPVQQGNSAVYLNKPAQQVSLSNHENVTYPVQQVYCDENLYKPVKQAYYNSTEEYFAKSKQPVYLQECHSSEQSNLSEYLSNRYQNTNPVNMQYVLYNPMQQNPQQIANGVLPLEKQTSNKNVNTHELQANTAKLPASVSYNYNGTNESQASSQLKSMLCGSYFRVAEISKPKINGLCTQFKKRQTMCDRNETLHQLSEALPQFQTREVQNTPFVDTVLCSQSKAVANQENVSSTTEIVLSAPLAAQSACELPTPPQYNYGFFSGKYRSNKGCSTVLGGFGENQILSPEISSTPNNNNDIYAVKRSEDSWGAPALVSEKPPVSTYCSSTIYIPRTYSCVSGGQERKNPGEFVSHRDAKVIKLKQRLEEQEATLKKLRASH